MESPCSEKIYNGITSRTSSILSRSDSHLLHIQILWPHYFLPIDPGLLRSSISIALQMDSSRTRISRIRWARAQSLLFISPNYAFSLMLEGLIPRWLVGLLFSDLFSLDAEPINNYTFVPCYSLPRNAHCPPNLPSYTLHATGRLHQEKPSGCSSHEGTIERVLPPFWGWEPSRLAGWNHQTWGTSIVCISGRWGRSVWYCLAFVRRFLVWNLQQVLWHVYSYFTTSGSWVQSSQPRQSFPI
jgi:hypothetical protein